MAAGGLARTAAVSVVFMGGVWLGSFLGEPARLRRASVTKEAQIATIPPTSSTADDLTEEPTSSTLSESCPVGAHEVRADIARRIRAGEFAPSVPPQFADLVAGALSDRDIALLSRPAADLKALAEAWSSMRYSATYLVGGAQPPWVMRDEAARNGPVSAEAVRAWLEQRRDLVRGCLGARGVFPGEIRLRVRARKVFETMVDSPLTVSPDGIADKTLDSVLPESTEEGGLMLRSIVGRPNDWTCIRPLLRTALFMQSTSPMSAGEYLDITL